MLHKIESIRNLNNSTYIIRMEKDKFEFQSGQYLSLGLPDDVNMREYSIYSGSNDPYLEVLIKEVKEGDVSVLLKKTKVGQALNVEGPYGFFTLREENFYSLQQAPEFRLSIVLFERLQILTIS